SVTEYWAPRPSTEPADLVPFTAEGVVREAAHTLPLKALCLRLAELSDGSGGPDPRAVHVDDALQAVERALAFDAGPNEPSTGWWAFHVVGAGRTRFPLGHAARKPPGNGHRAMLGYEPAHDLARGAPLVARPSEPPRRLTGQVGGAARKGVIFG